MEKNKWVLYRHTNDFELLKYVAVSLKNTLSGYITHQDKINLLHKLRSDNLYSARNPELPLDAISHRINTLAYFMFGYKAERDGRSALLFSPLGNLFLQNIDNRKSISKIFLTMLFAIQYPHPHGGNKDTFELYPYRLVFKLLNEDKLNYRIYDHEYALIISRVTFVNSETYEDLINQILGLRSLTHSQIAKLLKEDEYTSVNAHYEWGYYQSKLFVDAGILQKFEGETICRLNHGSSTTRILKENYVSLSDDIVEYCQKLLLNHPETESVLQINDPERLTEDVIKEIYNFYPKEILDELGEIDVIKYQTLQLTELIEKYSNNPDNETAYLFEEVLRDGFNLFYNVDAKLLGGAGKTDLECLYLTKKKKFTVDAKSTQNKLSGVNTSRLRGHRNDVGGEYTIVVTPRYVPAVLRDIQDSNTVIILSSTLSEYLYNHVNYDIREIDYEEIDAIIENNIGADISSLVSELTVNKFTV